jgi:hypothetical protein
MMTTRADSSPSSVEARRMGSGATPIATTSWPTESVR